MKIKWNDMSTCPRKVGEKVVVLLKFGFPFDRQLTILPVVCKWDVYTQGGTGNIPLGFWSVQPNGFTVDSRTSEELGWLPFEDFLPEQQQIPENKV